MLFGAPQKIYRLFNLIERKLAYGQGKGYGSLTMEQEVKHLQSFVKGTPKLAIDVGSNVGNYTAELKRKK